MAKQDDVQSSTPSTTKEPLREEPKPRQHEEPEAPRPPAAWLRWRDAWIGELVKEPDKIPHTVLLAGYVAESPDADSVRVYLDPCLLQCVDVPYAAVLHRVEIPRSASPLGGSYLWLEAAAWANVKWYQREPQGFPPQL